MPGKKYYLQKKREVVFSEIMAHSDLRSRGKMEVIISFLAAACIASIAISISMSHALIALCFLLYPFYLYFERSKALHLANSSPQEEQTISALLRKSLRAWRESRIPRPFFVGLCLYALIFFYKLLHALGEGQSLFNDFGALWSDVFLLLFAL